ncbi:hypothetical protein L208DRAFT_1326257, partial [Tricholoma matsutake]
LCCSSILGVGLDVPNITHVIHQGYPRDVISFVQETGCAERDDVMQKVWSVVVLPPVSVMDLAPGRFGERLVQLALDSTEHCCQLLVQMFIDGEADPCVLMEKFTHLCDICEEQHILKLTKGQFMVFPWSLMHDGLGGKCYHGIQYCMLTTCCR